MLFNESIYLSINQQASVFFSTSSLFILNLSKKIHARCSRVNEQKFSRIFVGMNWSNDLFYKKRSIVHEYSCSYIMIRLIQASSNQSVYVDYNLPKVKWSDWVGHKLSLRRRQILKWLWRLFYDTRDVPFLKDV